MAVRTAYVGTQSAGETLSSANFTKLPGGWIGYAEVTANQTGMGVGPTDLTSLTVTVTAGSSRRLLVSGYARITQQTSSSNPEVLIRNGSGTQLNKTTISGLAATISMHLPRVVVTPSSGSNTYKLSGSTAAGTMDLNAAATQPAFILVEDLGPSA
jgi:hypothetical protein